MIKIESINANEMFACKIFFSLLSGVGVVTIFVAILLSDTVALICGLFLAIPFCLGIILAHAATNYFLIDERSITARNPFGIITTIQWNEISYIEKRELEYGRCEKIDGYVFFSKKKREKDDRFLSNITGKALRIHQSEEVDQLIKKYFDGQIVCK